MVEQLHKPNVYQIKPVNGVGPGMDYKPQDNYKICQKAHNERDISLVMRKLADIPYFNPKVRLKEPPHSHKYATQAKGQPPTLVQSTIAGMGMRQ